MHGGGWIPVVVVQQHRVLRDAVQLRLDAETDLRVVASVATVSEATTMIGDHPASVVVLDEPADADSCRTVMDALRSSSPHVRVVMLVSSTELAMVSAAVAAGVAGVLCSDTPAASLVQAVRTVAGGVCVLDEKALRRLCGIWMPLTPPVLSAREREVLSLLADGSSNAEIASQLYVSTETVKTHVAHVLHKLEVPNRGSAVEKAARLGLLAGPVLAG